MQQHIKTEARANQKKLRGYEQTLKKIVQETAAVKGELEGVNLQIRKLQVRIKDDRRFVKHG